MNNMNTQSQKDSSYQPKPLLKWPSALAEKLTKPKADISKNEPELSPSIAKLTKPKKDSSKSQLAKKTVTHPEINGYRVYELAQLEHPFDCLNNDGDFFVAKEAEQHPKFYCGVIVSKEEMAAEHLKDAMKLTSSLVPVSGLIFRAFIRKGRVIVPRENVPEETTLPLSGFEIK
ncbi:hypothetical protein [Aliivibrio fischeri]|uniref:hypothetical protein n=1 Tax=Aliivibrio fischeri TaxID=668 RepID=UPI0007C499AC|nr:hypothetical protein [Aliivibrio fischeri]